MYLTIHDTKKLRIDSRYDSRFDNNNFDNFENDNQLLRFILNDGRIRSRSRFQIFLRAFITACYCGQDFEF